MNSILSEIDTLKLLLLDTDHVSNQIIESLVSTMQSATALTFITAFLGWLRDTMTSYGETIRKRAEWRARLRELEAMLEEQTNEPE